MRTIVAALTVASIAMIAPAAAEAQSAKTTTGLVALLAGSGLVAGAFDYRGGVCRR